MRRIRRSPDIPDIHEQLRLLTAFGEGAPTDPQKLQLVRTLRGRDAETDLLIDDFLVKDASRLRAGLLAAREAQAELGKRLQKLAAPPHHPAMFLGMQDTDSGAFALVCHGSSRRVVTIADDVDLEAIEIGDEVLLGSDLNVIIGRSPFRSQRGGETAMFERYTDDGRILIKYRDEEIVVDSTGRLARTSLRNGDLIRWERGHWLGFERLDGSRGDHLFLEETPEESFDDIGGLDTAIADLQGLVRTHVEHPGVVGKYLLPRRGSVLLVGPPGTGKTLLARAFANWLSQLSSSGRSRFLNIKPGSLHSMWYAETERNYREVFRVAREASLDEPGIPIVLFFDEIDAVGRSRSESMSRVDDRVLPALMTELNGLEKRGNVLVIAATNRADALDPALLRGQGRLGDMQIDVPRPRRDAARSILRKHLQEDIPFATDTNVPDAAAARSALIDAALSRIYAPNGGGELATLTFRDGKRRVIGASDLISGASIASICVAAKERALRREIETGASGIRLADVLRAVDDEFTRCASVLTPFNCRQHISGLPQDVDVASIEPIRRETQRTYRYLKIA